jgi:hypothetical protein
MGLKDWLFGRRARGAPSVGGTVTADEAEDDDVFARVINIPSRDFVGMSSKSPSKRYTIAWCDGGWNGSRIGRYILLDRGKIVAEGKMPRPNDGLVADNGVFVLNDWGASDSLNGVFAAFRPDGTKIVARKFQANLFTNGLSRDVRRATCQTANAPNDDGNLLTVFDLVAGREIGAWRPESGWAGLYEFPEDGRTIRLVYPGRGAFDYSFEGEFVGRMKWLAAGPIAGDLITVETLLRETNNRPPPSLVDQLLTALDVALVAPSNAQPKTRARIHRLRGVCFEATADDQRALEAYDQALLLDPKIGVKRRAEALRKDARQQRD